MLPDAQHWNDIADAPDKDGEAPDPLWRAFVDMCRRMERLEDEVARLRK